MRIEYPTVSEERTERSPLAIISGATGGIGRVMTARLWHAGYSVCAVGRSVDKLQRLHEEFDAFPHSENQVHYTIALAFPDAAYDHLAAICLRHQQLGGTLALLVTCHGAAPVPGPALQAAEAMRTVYEVDVLSTFALCQVAGRFMIEQRHGSIVLVSSLHARQTYPERVPYCVAKAAVCGMARALAVEWGPYNVRVNTLLPWQVDGERSAAFMAHYQAEKGEDLQELYRRRAPLRRLVDPAEVAEAVLWLSRSSSVTGQEFVLDAGVSASMWFEPFKER